MTIGLISEVVEQGTQLERAKQFANEISKAAPLGVQGVVASVQDAVHNGASTAFDNIHDFLPSLFNSEDAIEGIMATVERFEAEFKGR